MACNVTNTLFRLPLIIYSAIFKNNLKHSFFGSITLLCILKDMYLMSAFRQMKTYFESQTKNSFLQQYHWILCSLFQSLGEENASKYILKASEETEQLNNHFKNHLITVLSKLLPSYSIALAWFSIYIDTLSIIIRYRFVTNFVWSNFNRTMFINVFCNLHQCGAHCICFTARHSIIV